MGKKTKNKQQQEELDYLNNIAALISLYEQEIKDIMDSGKVAPLGCWIVRYQARGRNSRYWYYKLHSTEAIFPTRNPQKKSRYKHLGKAGSPAYLEGVTQVFRRAQIDGARKSYPNLEIWANGFSRGSSQKSAKVESWFSNVTREPNSPLQDPVKTKGRLWG